MDTMESRCSSAGRLGVVTEQWHWLANALGLALALGGCGAEPDADGSTADPTTGAGPTTGNEAPSGGPTSAPGSSGVDPDGDSGTGPGGSGDPTTGSSSGSSLSGGPPVECADGFHVEDGRLYDDKCNEFIMRGINYPYVWYSWRDDTAQQFADMASAGANAVRVVLANGEQWDRVPGEEITQVIEWARDHQMVAILEVHDATGWSEQASAADPQTAVDYWLSPDVREAIDGQESFVIINIANEPLGNTTTDQWVPFHSGAITQLRDAGVRHTLIVDGPNWGQDWSHTMRNGAQAQQIFDADPDANVIFSVHMYDVYGTDAVVEEYFTEFRATGLPLIVGEFAADHGPGAPVAAEAIMSRCEAMGLGYLGWSWSGNSGELSSLDVAVDFSAGNLSAWGQMLVNGPSGLLATSQTCTCFE
ncbi:MAG: glycoside hydrolase family 5 protein [Myxococcota bacterium]